MVERADALALLPTHYEVALRLSDAGATAQTIAVALNIEPAAIEPLLRIAEAKLQRVLADAPGGETASG